MDFLAAAVQPSALAVGDPAQLLHVEVQQIPGRGRS
jgi:hypothetical protein